MFKIHKKIKYALLSLKYMEGRPKEQLTTAKEICQEFNIPFDPTSRVLQLMTQHKILEAEQGAYGGYRLVKCLSDIHLFELSQMLVGPLAVTDCCEVKPDCSRLEGCVLKDPMARLNARLLKVFKEIKVNEMV